MIERRRLLLPHVEARARDLLCAQRFLERLLVMDAAARRGDEIGARLHQRILLRADHAARLVGQRAIDRDEIRLPHQLVELDLLDAVLRHHLGRHIGVVGEHPHREQPAAQLREALADIAEADDADGLVAQVVADEDIAVEILVAPHRAVGLDDALGEAEHHGERVLGDRLLVAAGLVEHQHARVGAGLQVHGVVAGAVGGDDQQALRAAQQIAVGVIFFRQLVARRADLECVRAREHRRRDIVGAVVLQLVEPDVAAAFSRCR